MNVLIISPLAGGSVGQWCLFRLTPENSLQLLWLLPQYLVMAAGEVLFSVTGNEFSYTQVERWGGRERDRDTC